MLQLFESFVCSCEVDIHVYSTCSSHHLQTNVHPKRRTIVRLVLVAINEGSPDTGTVANGVDECICCGTLRWWPRNGSSDPGVRCAIHSEDEAHQEEREVSGGQSVLYGQRTDSQKAYLGPKESVNMKMSQPTIVTGIGYMKNMKRLPRRSEIKECARAQKVMKM